MIRHIIGLSAAAVLLTALPAAAEITAEQLAPARADNGPCPESKTWIKNKTVVIRGAGTKQIEIYGWYIDTVQSASIEGLPGASARIVGTRGGPTNVQARCSTNGSLILSLTIPAVSEVKTAGLKLDGLRVPLQIYPWAHGEDIVWRTDNAATGQEESDAERRARYSAYEQQQLADRQRCVADNVAESDARSLCARLYPVAPIETKFPDQNTLRNQIFTRCGAPHGLKAEIYRNILTITLPADREAIGRCAAFPIVASHTQYSFYVGTLEMQGLPGFSHTQTGPLPYTPTRTGYSVMPPDVRRDIGLPRATVETLVGSIRQTYNYTGLAGSDSLVLIVKSEPGYGVKVAAPPLFTPGLGRLGSEIGIAVQSVEPTETGQVFEWNVSGQGAGIAITQCFHTLSGTLTPPNGSSRFTVTLGVKEEPRCYDKSFTVAVGPRGQVANPVFARTATFTLPPPTQVRGNGNLVDDRVKFQGVPPVIRP